MEGFQAKPAQLKKYLKQINNSFEQYLGYLGRLAFQEYLEGNLPNPPLQDACKTLQDLSEQRLRVEGEIAALEQMRQAARYPRCPFCGAPVPPGVAVCQACGRAMAPAAPGMPAYGPPAAPPPGAALQPPAPFPPQAAPPAPAAPFPPAYPPTPAQGTSAVPAPQGACSGCGAALEADALFCTNCGKPVETAGQEAPPTPEVSTQAPPAPSVGPAVASPPPGEPEAAAPSAPVEEAAATAVEMPAAPPPLAQEPPAAPPEGEAGGSVCSFCGEALEADAAFCTNCGKPSSAAAGAGAGEATGAGSPAPREAAAAEGAGTGAACPSCGAPQAEPDAVFCTECGSRLR